MRNDFGASHNFGAKINEKKRHGHAEIRISKTVYMKEMHFRRLIFFAEGEEIKISEAFDKIIQSGFAYQELMKVQEKKNLTTNEKNIVSNCSIVRER